MVTALKWILIRRRPHIATVPQLNPNDPSRLHGETNY